MSQLHGLDEENHVDRYAGYSKEIVENDDTEMGDSDNEEDSSRRLVGQYTASKEQMNEFSMGGTEEQDILTSRENQRQIQARETDYQKRRHERGPLTPTRADAFNQANGEAKGQSYREIMQQRELEREEERVKKLIADKEKENGVDGEEIVEHQATLKKEDSSDKENKTHPDAAAEPTRKRKKRWDVGSTDDAGVDGVKEDDKPAAKKSRWDTAPAPDGAVEAPKKRSRWDQAPSLGGATPVDSQPQQGQGIVAFGTDISARNAPLSDEDLDLMLPSEGYKILDPPPGYEPTRVAARRVTATPQSSGLAGGFMMQEPENPRSMGKQLPTEIPGVGDLQFFKQEDMAYFGKLVDGSDESEMSLDELKERKIMRLLLKIKNGTPPMRKTALRQMTDNCRQFGAGPCFNQILPLLMERTLEDQERHLLVKVIDRILYKLDDLVRPFVHKILVVIEPLLIDQDYYARVEGREIISNLSKAAGLATMISTMRPDIDHVDEYVRNTTARAFAVVASALGIPALLPFLRAVCRSKKSWQARHTGVKIVQQIPILMGCAVLPHLKGLVDCIGDNLNDEQSKVRTVTALAIAALAEAASPYGIESFDDILNPLWTGARLVQSLPYC